jgi:centrosomal protein CEP104
MSKEDRFIPECEIHIGDGISGSFVDAEYRIGGIGEQITSVPKQINTFGIGSYIKLVFTRQPSKTVKNPGGQVGLALLRIWGQPLGYNKGLTNEAHPLQGQTDTVDRVLIELGIPLNNIKWTNEDPENYSYAPVDEDTRITLIDMEKLKDKAHQTEDYEMLHQITKDLKIVYDLGNEILNLKRELDFVSAKEDYNKAIEIRNRLKQLEQERDRYDALYETSRYEDMIVMARPTSAQRRLAKKLEDEERARLEALRRQKEREAEEERLRRLREEEERERLRREEEDRKKRQSQPMKTVKKNQFNSIQQTKTVDVARDPLEYNDGDDDIDPYLNPKLIEAGGKVIDLENSVLKRALHSGSLLVTGVKLWSALHSDSWRHRDAASRAFLEYIQAPIKPKYHGKSRKLFTAAIDVAREACMDKLPQIYHTGLDILKTALNDPI